MEQDAADAVIHDTVAKDEAKAFDARIKERLDAGFVPDLRRAEFCDHFYKSFWRDPHYIRLYLGWIMDGLLDLLHTHCGHGLSILDVGCGAGYMSLELARAGHHVLGVDVSSECINAALRTRDDNPFTDGFGSLDYQVMPFAQCSGTYDVVLFCVSMHHMPDLAGVVRRARELVKPGGHLLCYEPCHERFQVRDAAQVGLIRGLLALAGLWFAPEEINGLSLNEAAMLRYFKDLHWEYVMERDKDEPDGQSPHDLSVSGEDILAALRPAFTEVETRPGLSFTYRVLGGLRGPLETLHAMADFLAGYERTCVANGFMNENMFFFLGRKDD